jgi:hypothetical protein
MHEGFDLVGLNTTHTLLFYLMSIEYESLYLDMRNFFAEPRVQVLCKTFVWPQFVFCNERKVTTFWRSGV